MCRRCRSRHSHRSIVAARRARRVPRAQLAVTAAARQAVDRTAGERAASASASASAAGGAAAHQARGELVVAMAGPFCSRRRRRRRRLGAVVVRRAPPRRAEAGRDVRRQ